MKEEDRDKESKLKEKLILHRPEKHCQMWVDLGSETKRKLPYNVKVSFHVGFRQHLMVLVFCLLSLFGSGMSFSFT